MKIKEKIKELRLKNNLTQENLAQKLNVSRQTISKWEQGLNEPSLQAIKELSIIFNVSVAELLGEEIQIKTSQEKKEFAGYITFLLVIGAAIFSVFVSFVMLKVMKETIPVHFNEFGEITRYGKKYESLVLSGCNILFLSLSIGVYLFAKKNPEYKGNVLITNIAMLTIITIFIIANFWWGFSNAKDLHNDLTPAITSVLFALMVVVFIFISPKINKQNFISGFRTSFTLTNKVAWNKINNFLSISGFLASLCAFIFSLIFFSKWSIIFITLPLTSMIIAFIYQEILKKGAK